MGNSKQKCKFTREPQLSANIREDRKTAKQDIFHRMVMKYLERKSRGDIYVNVIERV